MPVSLKAAPPHSVVLVCDFESADVPQSMLGGLISANSGCIAVGCLSELDGETEFVLGTTNEVDSGQGSAFDGYLETPTRRVVLRSVLGETLLEHEVSQARTRVRIWVNHDSEPDRIVVGLG